MTTYRCVCCVTIANLATAPLIPRASASLQYVFLRTEFIQHSRSGNVVRRGGLAVCHRRSAFFANPRPKICSVIGEMTGMTAPWPEVVDSVTRLTARIAARAARDPVWLDAPVLPLWMSVLIQPRTLSEADVLEQSFSEAVAAGPRAVPADKAAVEALEEVSSGEFEDGDQCSICLNEFVGPTFDHDDEEFDDDDDDEDDKKILIRMPCWHLYHKSCIVKWLEESHLCPLCRCALPLATTY